MALINCPECDTQVSDKAEKCPKCAFPIGMDKAPTPTPASTDIKQQIIVKPKEGCFLQTLNVGCMIIAVVIGLIVLIAVFS